MKNKVQKKNKKQKPFGLGELLKWETIKKLGVENEGSWTSVLFKEVI